MRRRLASVVLMSSIARLEYIDAGPDFLNWKWGCTTYSTAPVISHLGWVSKCGYDWVRSGIVYRRIFNRRLKSRAMIPPLI
jgi:hypothetical protein